MIVYHGSYILPAEAAIRVWTGRHAMISHAHPQQLPIALEVAESVALDNGAFSAWRAGREVDWPAYYDWVESASHHPGFAWAVIPDSIDGGEDENDLLLGDWRLRGKGIPVWHLHESLERLERLIWGNWPLVALGSSGQWRTPGTSKWWGRMAEAMEVCCDGGGWPQVKLHGLRMMNPTLAALPLASVDSTVVGRNIHRPRWQGVMREAGPVARAIAYAMRFDGLAFSPVWQGAPLEEQLGLWAPAQGGRST